MTCTPRDASTSLHQRPQSSEQRLEMPESWTLVGPGVPGAEGRGGLVVAGVVSTWRVPPPTACLYALALHGVPR